jgi:uncharacterized OsmC-like protein
MRAILPPIQLSTPAWVTHLAWTEATGAEPADRVRGAVRLGLSGREVSFAAPDTSGERRDDLLCAGVAAGLDSSVRKVAARADLAIERLAVIVTGDVDARGGVGDADAPVGFQSLRVEVRLRLASRDPDAVTRTVTIAERQCVTLQTLRAGVPVELVISDDD